MLIFKPLLTSVETEGTVWAGDMDMVVVVNASIVCVARNYTVINERSMANPIPTKDPLLGRLSGRKIFSTKFPMKCPVLMQLP